MNVFDYLLDVILLATVFFQFRGRKLSWRYIAIPVVIVAYFLFAYLKGVPTGGNDVYLIIVGILLGLIFGIGAGYFTKVYTTPKGVYAKAGLIAGAFWTIGVILRTTFSLYAVDGGANADRSIGSFMHNFHITNASAIVACLLLMVLAEVLSRQLILGVHYINNIRKEKETIMANIDMSKSTKNS